MSDIFAGLNDRQREAVEVLSGPLLILAGAGSGKTKCLTHRIANLIANGVPGEQILAVTFTNKAAGEIKSRVQKLLSAQGQDFLSAGTTWGERVEALEKTSQTNAKPSGVPMGTGLPMMGTFHSICVRILREDVERLECGLHRSFVIFDTDDTLKLMKLLIKESPYDDREIKPRAVLGMISSAKSNLQTAIEVWERGSNQRFFEAVQYLMKRYNQRLLEHNAMDFDDLLQKTVELFEACPEVLEKYRRRWQHLLVDEYQDTNFAQYRFVRLLAENSQNICVIGDDHQSIYSFRGADYTNILNFEKDYPKAKIIKLEQNYRSTSNILANANRLIKHNRTGHEKNLWTHNEEGEPLLIAEQNNERAEGEYIADRIASLRASEGYDYADMAVLYRMNAQSRAIEEAFMRRQIPYQIVGGTKFFERAEIKDVIAYLRVIFNPRDDIAFLRIVNVPTRGIGASSLDKLREYALEKNLSLSEAALQAGHISDLAGSKALAIENFAQWLETYRRQSADTPLAIMLESILEDIKYFAYLDDGTSEGEMRAQNVRELFSVIGRYEGAENALESFLEGVALITDLDNLDQGKDAVTLMTIHASKGLEFPVVFLPGWEEGIFPSNNAQYADDALEEERRLAYVAITRAQKQCTITHARQRMLFGRTEYGSASSFLSELDEECIARDSEYSGFTPARKSSASRDLPWSQKTPSSRQEWLFGVEESSGEYKVSDRIRHNEWGEGTIVRVSGDVLSVAFSGKGIKKIVASVAPIEKI